MRGEMLDLPCQIAGHGHGGCAGGGMAQADSTAEKGHPAALWDPTAGFLMHVILDASSSQNSPY